MIDSNIEFAFLKQCFTNPDLWVYKFQPIDPLASWVNKKVAQYQTEFHKYPNLETFLAYIKKDCTDQQYELIGERLTDDRMDSEFVHRAIVEFVEGQNIKVAATKAIQLLSTGKVKEAKQAMFEGTEIIYNPPSNYFGERKKVAVPTVSVGYTSIDKPLGGGGPRGSLLLVIAPSSVGKSLSMLNMAGKAAWRGETVLHITAEDTEEQVASRYDKLFASYRGSPKGKLFIHECLSGDATVADFDAVVNSIRPDIVIVDHINVVGVAKSNGNISTDLGVIAKGLRAMAQRYNCLVITAQQGSKSKKFSDVDVTAEDGFWSYEPTQVADIVLTLNQTRDEREQGKLRINIDKNRNGPANTSLDFLVNYEQMLIKEDNGFSVEALKEANKKN